MGYVGRSVPRVEDPHLLRGRGRFVGNLQPVRNLHEVAFVRSPHPHARIRGVDASGAQGAKGVLAVVTGRDAARHLKPFSVGVSGAPPYWPIAIESVRYVGEPVAMVVATDAYLAADAAEVVVDYEPVGPQMEVRHADVISYRRFSHGNVDDAFPNARHRITGEFHFPRYSSTPIECYAVI